MMRLTRVFLPAFVVFGCVAAAGCWQHGHWAWDREEKIAQFAKYHRKFGEIAVGRPVVISKRDALKFELGLTARDLYDAVGTQFAGRLGQFDVASFRGALAFQAPTVPVLSASTELRDGLVSNITQTLLENAAGDASAVTSQTLAGILVTALTGQVAATTEEPPPDEEPEPETAVLAPMALPANAAAARSAELANQANVFGPLPPLTLRTRDRASEAHASFTHIRLLELFSNPAQFGMPEGVQPILLAGNITVSPGTVTKEGFIAEVSLKLSLADRDGEVPFGQYHAIPVISVFPSTVGQNMDLQSLTAYQRDLALQLSAAGYGSAGQALLESSRLTQTNLRGLNQRVSISSFTRGATNHFGYRIRGEVWAANPNGMTPESVELLQDINVPFVAVALEPINTAIKAVTAAMKRSDPNFAVDRDYFTMRMDVETRWIAADEWTARKAAWWHPELRPIEGFYRARVADTLWVEDGEAIATLKAEKDNGKYVHFQQQWSRTAPQSVLSSGMSGYKYILPLPAEPKEPGRPRIAGFFPKSVPVDRRSVVIVTGSDFGKAPLFTFAGVRGELIKTYQGGKVAAVVVDPVGIPPLTTRDGGVGVVTSGGAHNTKDGFAFVEAYRPPNRTTTIKDGTIKLEFIEVHGGAKPELFEDSEIEELIEALIKKLGK